MTSYDDISVALNKLAAEGSAEQIAVALLAQNCRGIPGLVDRCPVANYVRTTVQLAVEIESGCWSYDDGSAVWCDYLPPNVMGFVRDFDSGEYPQLNSSP